MISQFARRPPSVPRRFGPGSELIDDQVERHVIALRDRFVQDAGRAVTDVRTLEVQFRLHMPSVPHLIDENAIDVYEEVRTSVVSRAGFISQTIRDARAEADNYNLEPSHFVVHDGVRRGDGTTLPIEFHSVTPTVGMRYQRDMHYLRSPRTDTVLHFGAFEPGARFPLLYLGFSVSERDYVKRALDIQRSLNGVVLTRAVSVVDLPYNLMSRTIAAAVRHLVGVRPVDFLETAYNPYLGFNGASFRSSNFLDFATAPVSYYYDQHRSYTPRRNAESRYPTANSAERATPANVISVLAFDRKLRNLLTSMEYPVQIMKGKTSYTPLSQVPAKDVFLALESYRGQLEDGWSARTVHPDFAGAPQGSPKGQCGVTSVWLARELRAKFRVESTYCYGELRSADGDFGSVSRHCWIEIGRDDDTSRYVIDLTADQADGFDRAIVMDSWSELVKNGILYEPRIRKSLDELSGDAVWPRFLALSDALATDIAA